MGPPRAPPPAHYNFAQHVLAANAGARRKARVRRRRADALLRRTRATASRGWRTRSRRWACGARSACCVALHDTVDFPVAFLGALHAGVVPVLVNTLLTVDDYAYMLEHSRAQALVVSGALVPTFAQAMARAAHEVKHVVVSRPAAAAADGHARLRRAAGRAAGDAAGARRDARRRHRVLALFVGLDRAPEGHRAHARQPALDRGALRPAGDAACARTTSCSRPRSCSSPTGSATR